MDPGGEGRGDIKVAPTGRSRRPAASILDKLAPVPEEEGPCHSSA